MALTREFGEEENRGGKGTGYGSVGLGRYCETCFTMKFWCWKCWEDAYGLHMHLIASGFGCSRVGLKSLKTKVKWP